MATADKVGGARKAVADLTSSFGKVQRTQARATERGLVNGKEVPMESMDRVWPVRTCPLCRQSRNSS